MTNIHDLARWFQRRGARPLGTAGAWETSAQEALAPGMGGADSPELTAVHLDSRQVVPGSVFVALRGTAGDGRRFVSSAVQAGAVAVLVEGNGETALHAQDALTRCEVPVWSHPEARRLCGELAAELLGHPSRELDVIAITGTNGKTTSAHLLGALLSFRAETPALLGTTGYRLADGVLRPATHTTPDAPTLQALFAEHRRLGGGTVVMEASSHALEQERLAGTEVDVAVFTNLSRDHLDYHGDMEAYAESKARLFASLSPRGVAILNADDREHPRMAHAALTRGAPVLTTSLAGPADLWANHLLCEAGRTRMDLHGMGLDHAGLWVPLTGAYNVANLLQALACARWLGVEADALLAAAQTIVGAPGRMERVDLGPDRPQVWVDYAHSPEALERALQTLQGVPAQGRLTVVFGCGGDRDVGKRAWMGQVAGRWAQRVVVTSDNPRSEDPRSIADQILEGVRGVTGPHAPEVWVELDRREAIRWAVQNASAEDRILIAGKGHEATQIFADREQSFDDRLVAQEVAS